MFSMQGATYLMLRTEGAVYERAKQAARYTALAVLVSVLAGIWVWLGIDGYVIQQMPPPDALPNPVNKVTH